MVRSLLRFVVVGLAPTVLVAPIAQAEQTFPSVVQSSFDMLCAPRCTLCHATDPGQGTNYTARAFTLSVIRAYQSKYPGKLPTNDDEMKVALTLLKDGKVDTDGDQVLDDVELNQGNDPNKPGQERLCGPNYGCGAHVAKAPAKNGEAWVLAACAAVVATFGFRRRRSS
jgi:hypothetical protein